MPLDRRSASALALATVFTMTGVTHFVAPAIYEPIVPRVLPGSARGWVLVSGLAELAGAAAVAAPRTRRLGGAFLVVLLLAVFPANVQMALDWNHQGPLKATLAWARLPLQMPLTWWAWRVGRSAAPLLEHVQK